MANIISSPEDFTTGHGWGYATSTVSGNQTAAPNFSQTADKINENTNGNYAGYIYYTYTASASTYYMSSFLKANERTWAYLRLDDNITFKYCWFNLSTGVVGTKTSGVTGAIRRMRNSGWFQCSMSVAVPSGTAYGIISPCTADNTFSYTGTIGYGIFAWGAQMDLGAVTAVPRYYQYPGPFATFEG